MNQSRFHRVKVDQTDGLSGGVIDHHVIDLGISVDRSSFQFTSCAGLLKNIDPLSSLLDEGDGLSGAMADLII